MSRKEEKGIWQKAKKMMDAVLAGSIDWTRAREAAIAMTRSLRGEIDDLERVMEIQDAYSPIAWLNVCQQLRVVTDGMVVMRKLAEGKAAIQITAETGILPGSIAAYKAWNTMYLRAVNAQATRSIRLKGRTEAEQQRDIEFLRACGIAFDLTAREEESQAVIHD